MNAIPKNIDLSDAETFLRFIDPDASRFTFQTFDDGKGHDQKLARILHGSLDEHAAELKRLNTSGAGVFVTINETDLKGRMAENIVRVRALFVDLDGAPLDPVLGHNPAPHMVVTTSPGRWHAYWRVQGMDLADFGGAQSALIEKFGADPSVKDLPRVMRLPGFLHVKAEPCHVTIRNVMSDAPTPYPASIFVTSITPAEAKRFVLPNVIAEGGRNSTLFKYGCSLQSKGWSDEEVSQELEHVNANRCDPPLARKDIDRVIKQALKYPKGKAIPDWVAEINENHAVVAEAGKARVLNIRDWDPSLNRRVLTSSTFADFKNLYGNQYVEIGRKANGDPVYAAKGEAWLKHPERAQYKGTTFTPGRETPGWFNLWQGFSVEPRAGDWSLLKDHLSKNICNGNEAFFSYLMGWMAFAVQKPDVVPEVAVVLLGGRGTGKNVAVNALGSLMREHYVPLSNPRHVTGNFNAHLRDAVLLFLDEPPRICRRLFRLSHAAMAVSSSMA